MPAASKSSGHADGSASHSRFPRPSKLGKGKQAVSTTLGSRSGLEPGCVSGGVPPPVSKSATGQGSGSRPGSKVKPATKGVIHGSRTAPGGKTLSMENIQSLSAVYATSGTMYPSEQDPLEPSGGYPKGTMTLGRSTSRSSNSSRTRAIGSSSPNITSSALHHSSDRYEDKYLEPAGTSSLRRQYGRALDPAGQGDAPTFDVQAQLRNLQRENDNLRRELDRGRSCSTNNVYFWSPEVKRDKGVRREEGVRSLKDQYRSNHEDVQVRGGGHRVCLEFDSLHIRIESAI